jgi:hypothetical protein
MTKNARIALVASSIGMLLALIIVRQANQMLFIHIQEIDRQQRIEQQALNRVRVEYLQAKEKVPIWALANGYVMRRQS